MSLNARKVICIEPRAHTHKKHYTICFDWPPAGGSNGAVGVRFIALKEAIIFLRVKLSSPLTKCLQMKKKGC